MVIGLGGEGGGRRTQEKGGENPIKSVQNVNLETKETILILAGRVQISAP